MSKETRISARQFFQAEDRAEWNKPPDYVSRRKVYDDHTRAIAIEGTPTSETRRQADRLFDDHIKEADAYKPYKEQEKRVFFQRLVHAAKRALYHRGCILAPRDRERGDCSAANLQVIECAVESQLFIEHRSPPGSPKMTRLLPTQHLARLTGTDPWEFDPHEDAQFVFLRDRDTKEEIEFDEDHPVAARYQKKLAKINRVNAQISIFYRPISQWDQSYGPKRQLRPVHYAMFTDDFDQHGRIYTGHYGHQALRKLERATIEFEMSRHALEPMVELDYGGLHPRLAYHLKGIDYRRDPYALWGDATTPPMRLMAKVMLNAALNAKDATAAISDCNRAMSTWTKDTPSRRKQGKSLEDAIRLYDAAQRTNLKFSDIYDLALQKHSRIADQFSSDAGMRLMRIDSEIALNVMYYFARHGIPCLGVHDSFIVPRTAETELRRVMRKYYRQKTGFWPVIK